MSWSSLPPDVQESILDHALLPRSMKVCLEDDYRFHAHAERFAVAFCTVVGVWVSPTAFACNIDADSVPAWDPEESGCLLHWMSFRLRRTPDGLLALPSGDDEEWTGVGWLKNRPHRRSRWHGVLREATYLDQYNCILEDGVPVHSGCPEDHLPGYTLRLYPADKPTRDPNSAEGLFNGLFYT